MLFAETIDVYFEIGTKHSNWQHELSGSEIKTCVTSSIHRTNRIKNTNASSTNSLNIYGNVFVKIITGQAIIEARSCNHCCSGKAISITYFGFVFVVTSMHAHAPYCHLYPVRLYNIFPHNLINSIIFRGGGSYLI